MANKTPKHNFRWGYGKLENTLVSLEIEFPSDHKPSKLDVLKALEQVRQNYKTGSEFNLAKFKCCTVFASIVGWGCSWNAYFDNVGQFKDRPNPSEPTGKHTQSRYSFNLK